MPPRFGFLVGAFGAASENHDDAARLVELDDHVGTFVDGPDVVVLIDAHAVGFGPGVKTLADFTQVRAVGAELKKLRRRRRVGGTVGAVGSREHEDVPLGIDGHARDLAEIHSGRKLEEIRNGVKSKFRHALLREQRRSEQHGQQEKTHFHLH